MNRPCKGKSEGFSFPEDLLPACTRVDSAVPLMTMVNCLLELCRCGGSYVLLSRLWCCFRAKMGTENPLYNFNRSQTKSLVFPFVLDVVHRVCLVVSLSNNGVSCH